MDSEQIPKEAGASGWDNAFADAIKCKFLLILFGDASACSLASCHLVGLTGMPSARLPCHVCCVPIFHDLRRFWCAFAQTNLRILSGWQSHSAEQPASGWAALLLPGCHQPPPWGPKHKYLIRAFDSIFFNNSTVACTCKGRRFLIIIYHTL